MLRLNGETFTEGVAPYYEQEDTSQPADKTAIYVHVVLDSAGQRFRTLAILDTGTPWCIFNTEINDALGLSSMSVGRPLLTPYGKKTGSLERLPIMIAAKRGQSLELQATAFVCDDWSHGNFLGYSGLLQRFRFAIDPSSLSFYFGAG